MVVEVKKKKKKKLPHPSLIWAARKAVYFLVFGNISIQPIKIPLSPDFKSFTEPINVAYTRTT